LGNLYATGRVISEGLENVLNQEFKVLNKGFVRVVDYMGNDSSIVQAARVSYGKGTKTTQDDVALIRYLLKHKHTTPFEMCEIKLHIKAPIFIARQWLRHRTASVNEYSARYSIIEEEYYVPETENIRKQSSSNKQGRGESLSAEESQEIQNKMDQATQNCFTLYNEFIKVDDNNNELVAKELARSILPVNIYTQFYWKIDLHNLMHFLRLRCDSHAQYEIREYANIILDVLKLWLPSTHQAFLDYHINATNFSAQEMAMLHAMLLEVEMVDKIEGLSIREYNEFKNKIKEGCSNG
jgi:thymidylate synthase (FAD)